jgi:C-terminal processing protease CtpA/Prc
MTVLPESPGDVAGLAVGDIITGIDGQPPGDDPEEPAFQQPVGTVVHLTVKRGDEVRKIDVTLKDVI